MDRNPEQAIVGRFALWINDINPSRSYWILILTNYGIYDTEESYIQNLLKKYSQTPLSDLSKWSRLFPSKSRLEVTLDMFLWLYFENKSLCFQIMKDIYDDFKDDENIPEPYEYVEKLEEYVKDEQYPNLNEEDIVPVAPQVIEEGAEFKFYQRVHPHFEQATEEVFIVDPYVDDETIGLYLSETSTGVDKRILTDQPEGNFDEVAKKFVKRRDHRIEVRATPKCHDRLMFIDDRCFLVGISLKDAGRNPNYLVEFESVERFRKPWEQMWDDAEEYGIFE